MTSRWSARGHRKDRHPQKKIGDLGGEQDTRQRQVLEGGLQRMGVQAQADLFADPAIGEGALERHQALGAKAEDKS